MGKGKAAHRSLGGVRPDVGIGEENDMACKRRGIVPLKRRGLTRKKGERGERNSVVRLKQDSLYEK